MLLIGIPMGKGTSVGGVPVLIDHSVNIYFILKYILSITYFLEDI